MQPLQNPSCLLFVEINKLIVKFIWEVIRIVKTILKKQNVIGVLTLPNFKYFYKYLRQCGIGTDQWDRIRKTELIPYIYGQCILDKNAKLFSGKRIMF